MVYNVRITEKAEEDLDLKTHEMTHGDLPLKAQNLVNEWLKMHDQELQKMWDTQTIVKLAPLG